MFETVENFLTKYSIYNQTVIIGFSGGPDSCALALILKKLSNKFNLNIVLANFNHNWRKESKSEEDFTKDFARKINALFYIEKAPANTSKTEEKARELRYKFFEKTAKKFNSKTVLLAHNKNDNVETLIYRLIKGTSVKGLCSIPENREIYYRPLLGITKKQILNYLKQNNQEYCFDCSNNDTRYNRNYIRNNILPLFEKINSNYIENIDLLIKNAQNTKEITDEKIQDIMQKIILSDNKYNLNYYKTLNQPYRLELLYLLIGKYLKNLDSKSLHRFDNFLSNKNNSKTSINSNLFLITKESTFEIQETKKSIKKEEIIIQKCGEYNFENIIFKIEKINKIPKDLPQNNDSFCFLNLQEDFNLTLRHRKNGDIFTPLGLKKGKMKLKDYFINSKIPQDKKDDFILLCNNKEVIWILNNRINENYKITSNNGYKLSWSKVND